MVWKLNSHEQLVLGGYLFRRRIVCRRCGREVLLYGVPGGGGRAILVEPQTYQPHRIKCAPAGGEESKQKELF